jgi:hypothetical protein
MIGNNIPAETKPEEGKGSKDFALFGDAAGKDHIKGRNPVGGDDEKPIRQVVDIPYLSPFEKL